jgi:hypothetical protein
MGLARGVAIRPVDFQIPVLQLPFEQIYSQMQQMQQEKDTFEAMQGMLPQYIGADREKVIAGAEFVKDISTDVAKKFAAGNVKEAMSALRGAKESVAKMWSPTGVFGATQGFYDDYQKAIKEVDEFTKGNTDPAYNYVYKRMVQKAAEQGSQFDPTTGKRATVSAPDMLKEVDVLKEFMEFGKGWGSEADQTVGIEKYGDYYYYIGTDKKVPPEEVRAAWNSFISSPKIQNHLRIQASYETAMMGDNAEDFRDQLIMDAQTTYNNQKKQLDIVEQMLNSSNVNTRKQAQRELGVATDGIVGEETKKALSNLRSELDGQLEEAKSLYESADIENLVKNRLERTMGNAAVQRLAFSQEDGKLIGREEMFMRDRYRYQSRLDIEKEQRAALTGQEKQPAYSNVGAAVLNVVDMATATQDAQKNYTDAYNALFTRQPELAMYIKSMTGDRRYGEAVPKIAEALQDARKSDGTIDGNVFKRRMTQLGFTDRDANKSYKDQIKSWDDLVTQINGRQLTVDDFTNAADNLEGYYNSFLDSKAVYSKWSDRVLSSDELKLDKMAVKKGDEIISTPRGIVRASTYYTSDELKEGLRKGDPKIVQGVQRYLKENKLQGYDLIVPKTGFVGGAVEKYDALILKTLQNEPGALAANIDLNKLVRNNPNAVEKLGIQRQADGTYGIDPSLKVTTFSISSFDDNGKATHSVTIGYEKGEGDKKIKGSVNLDGYVLNTSMLNERYVDAASTYINPDGTISNFEAFGNAAARRFDLTNGSSQVTNQALLARNISNNIHNTYRQNVYQPEFQRYIRVTASTMLRGDGSVVYVYGVGRDAALAIEQANGDFATYSRLKEVSPGIEANLDEREVGTFKRNANGTVDQKSIRVNEAGLGNAIYSLKAASFMDDTRQAAIRNLRKRKMTTQEQYLDSGSLLDYGLEDGIQ